LVVLTTGAATARAGTPSIQWDTDSLQLALPQGNYGRIIRRADGALLLAAERGGQVVTRVSQDLGRHWGLIQPAASVSQGQAANPELLLLHNRVLLMFYNDRPRDAHHHYAIRMSTSRNGGQTWEPRPDPVYTAGTRFGDGCWEPAAIQLPDGEIQLFFANENPYRNSAEQEITLLRSFDEGLTWSVPERVSFRAGKRDGMPSPCLLTNPPGLALAIEDNGLTPDGQFKPAILYSTKAENWRVPPTGAPPRRTAALPTESMAGIYAGAPCLRQLPAGALLLSCQTGPAFKQAQMEVFLAPAPGREFRSCGHPFPLPPNTTGWWNSLLVLDARTVLAITSTRLRNQAGIWIITGHLTL
jgi:hypothetical protein